jgi:hypothetical protein
MPPRNNRENIGGSQQAVLEGVIGSRHQREMYVTALKSIRHAGASILD